MSSCTFKAVIVDLDGVLTRTADVHARAWQHTFDAFLVGRAQHSGRPYRAFDITTDYLRYLDGKPRYDGARSFLESRGIQLPWGDERDPPGRETVCGLGNRKNELFRELLDRDGVAVFDDAVAQIRRWRGESLKTAVITSSRNGRRVLASAELTPLFDVVIDGNDLDRLNLLGKPAPDVFLHAARELCVSPREAVVIEDAIAGVQAGRAGGFGLVVGVARNGDSDVLGENGADLVVSRLSEIDLARSESSAADSTDILDNPRVRERFAQRLQGKRIALFLDYDGTLTPIVERPEMATLSEEMRSAVQQAAETSAAVAIISGRDLADVRRMVGLENLVFAGSHGFDIAGPHGLRMQHEAAQNRLPDLDVAESALRRRLAAIDGCRVERKRFAIAVHFREADDADIPDIERTVEIVRRKHPRLRRSGGKKIFELQPDIAWDKGRAVLWLLQTLGLDRPDVLPIYVGDDVTDEDAFRALRNRGVGICVGCGDRGTLAGYSLRDTEHVRRFLRFIAPLSGVP